MVAAPDRSIGSLRANIGGSVICSEDPGYDEARRTWNADIDRRPAVIVRCASAEDVVTGLVWLRRRDLRSQFAAAHTAPRDIRCATTVW
jgi:hypothetical protein